MRMGETAKSIEQFETAHELALSLNDFHARHEAQVQVGMMYAMQGNLTQAEDMLRHVSSMARSTGALWRSAHAQMNLAASYSEMGQPQRAVSENSRSIAILRELNETVALCVGLASQSSYLRQLGELDAAEDALSEAAAIAEETRGNHRLRLLVTREQGELALARRQWDAAQAYLEEASAICAVSGDVMEGCKTNLELARLFMLTEDWPAFAAKLAQAETEAQAGQPLFEARVLQLAGAGAVAQGDVETAVATYRRAYDLFTTKYSDPNNHLARRLAAEARRALVPHADHPQVQALLAQIQPD